MDSQQRRVLVTGANGFIGAHLTRDLISKGYAVRAMVRTTSDLSALSGLDIEYSCADLGEPDTLLPALEGIPTVIHMAGITRATDPREYYLTNVQGTVSLLDACLRSPDLERFVFISSAAAAGPSWADRPRVETDSPDPVGPYGRSKLEAEAACAEAAGKGLPVTVIRPCAVYGKWERDLLELFKWSRRRIAPVVGGDTVMSLIHAGDLADLIERAARLDSALGRTYFAADPEPYSVRNLLRIMGSFFGRRAIPVPLPSFMMVLAAGVNELLLKIGRGMDILTLARVKELRRRFWAFDSTKAQEELDWRPARSIVEGLRETAEWYLENGWL